MVTTRSLALRRVFAALALGSICAFAAGAAADDVLRLSPPAPLPSPPYRPPAIRSFHLNDGLHVVVVERHTHPTVAIAFASDRGATAAPAGIANVATRVVAEDGAGIMDRPEEAAGTARRWTGCTLDGVWSGSLALSSELDTAVANVAAATRTPAFHAWAFDDVRAAQLSEASRFDDDEVVAFAAVFPESHPLHAGTIGDANAVRAISRDALRDYWGRAFSRGHVTAVVVGDVTTASAIDVVGRALADLPRRADSVRADGTPSLAPSAAGRVTLRPRSGEQAHVVVAGPAPARASREYWPVRVLLEILAGTGSGASRLFHVAREAHGYTYGMVADIASRRDGVGVLRVSGAVAAGHAGEGAADILAELERIAAQPVSDAELARAKARLTQSALATFDTNVALAGALAEASVRGLPFDEPARVPAEIASVSRDDVLAAARRWATPSRMSVTLLGDVSDLRRQAGAVARWLPGVDAPPTSGARAP